MPGYIIVDAKTKKTLVICTLFALALFIAGVLIGYFSARKPTSPSASSGDVKTSVERACKLWENSETANRFLKRYTSEKSARNTCADSKQACLELGLPRRYTAYHLRGRRINIDGDLNDIAWNEVPWSEPFVDIRSATYPQPPLDTRFKIRWDDDRLYIGAKLRETNLWATKTVADSRVFEDNCIDILMDVDGTLFNYKQIQVNVLGTLMDQVLYKSPHDGGTKLKEWQAEIQSAVKTSGTINMSRDKDDFWSVELSLSFKALASLSKRTTNSPAVGEVWFMQLGRPQYKLQPTTDGGYTVDSSQPDWWAWQPCDAVNLQLQDRWGLVQFKKDIKDDIFSFPRWHIYKALFETLNAVKSYKAIHSKYPPNVEDLNPPPYLMSGACVEIPEVVVYRRDRNLDFNITTKSKVIPNMSAQIRSDRYVTFNPPDL